MESNITNFNDRANKFIVASGFSKFIVYLSFLLIIPLIWFIVKRNSFFKMQTKIDESASGIDVQLKRRRDSLTKLIDSVKGSMNFEKETLQKIVELRTAKFGNMKSNSELNSEMDNILKSINVTLENYPNLKSTDAIVNFQNEVSNIEEEISASRRIYNQNVSIYNQQIQMWPGNVVASGMGLSLKDFFEASDLDRQDVKVDF